MGPARFGAAGHIAGATMALYRYHVSNDPAAPSPPYEALLTIEADSAAAAAEQIKIAQPPETGKQSWVNILIWMSTDGKQLGFHSFRMANP